MGVRTYEATPGQAPLRTPGPGWASTLAVGGLSTLLLLANGRPLGAPQSTDVAGALLEVVLRPVGLLLELDPTGRAVVGKVLAALCAGTAAAALFAAVARRHTLGPARTSGLVLALGTTLAAASQSWSGEPAATAAVAVAVLLLTRSAVDDDPAVAAPAAVPLALAVVLEPTSWALALALVAGSFVRWWRSILRLLAWAVPAAFLAALGLSSSPESAGGDVGVLALLVSPARGLFVFAPALLVGGVALARTSWPSRLRWNAPRVSAWLPLTMAAGAVAHVAAVTLHGGAGGAAEAFWGPRLLAPLGPPILLFLPEGLALLRGAGALVVALSVAVQVLGALSYDGRWDRLHGSEAGVAWDPSRSPIAFQVRERVVRLALPSVEGRRLVVREHPLVVAGPTGSRIVFRGDSPVVMGADPTLGDVLLEGGARVRGERLRLEAIGDALFFRVRESARFRRLELRIEGHGSGVLAVGETTFWTSIRWSERGVRGAFDVRRPWTYADSAGGDIRVASRGPGALEIHSVALVPPGEPDDVIRLE